MISRLFLLLVVLLVSGKASASVPPSTGYYMTGYPWFNASTVYTSAAALCTAFAAARNGQDPQNPSTCSSGTQGPSQVYLDRAGSTRIAYDIQSKAWCPATNTAPSGGLCPDPPPPSCPKGQATTDWYPSTGKSSGFPTCAESGCSVDISSVGNCIGLASTGVTWCEMKGTTNGSTCNSSAYNSETSGYGSATTTKPTGGTRVDMPTTKVASNAVPCPSGTVQGGVDKDGVPLCVGSGTAPKNADAPPPTTTSPPVTVQNADGSSTTTQTTTQTNKDGSTTTTVLKTTTAADGTKTVTQTQNTGAATGGGSGKKDDPAADQNNLCKQNPDLAICKNSTVTGDCNAGVAAVACTGDAVQCATLRQVAVVACKQRQDDLDMKGSGMFAKGSGVVNGNDPDAASLPTVGNGSSVAVPSSLNTSGFGGAGAAFADVSFTVQGKTFVLPLAKWSGYLLTLRYVMMVIAALVSFRLLSGAILRD
jgi:hypothetical protein